MCKTNFNCSKREQDTDRYVKLALLAIASICVGVMITLFASAKNLRDKQQNQPKQEISEYDNGNFETRIA